ncbi:hypothetical protein [Halomarina pelagica]|uniref:hypothetical protein n=1 Tax=Halomarina pelagica TaxID=2961599 RepID=UPI0020C5521B|nr:hypothetical protein [Halomarina sp. BND7]
MLAALLRTVRERYTLRHLAGYVAVLGVCRLAFDFSIDRLATLGISIVGIELWFLVRDTVDPTPWKEKVGVGVLVLAGSAVMGYDVARGGDGAAWFPVLTTLGGLWLLLDAACDRRYGPRDRSRRSALDDVDQSEFMLYATHANLVVQELRRGPRTIEELAAACDLTESRVEEALEAAAGGIVHRRGDRYVVDEAKLGAWAFVRDGGRGLARLPVRAARRAARPFRLFA